MHINPNGLGFWMKAGAHGAIVGNTVTLQMIVDFAGNGPTRVTFTPPPFDVLGFRTGMAVQPFDFTDLTIIV